MNRMIWHRWAIAVQLINALLLFAFSIYLGVTAYPLVAFFQDRGVSAAYVLNVAVIVTLGFLILAEWWYLRKQKVWAWWLAVFADASVFFLTGNDSLSCGLRDRDCLVFVAMSLSSMIACACLFVPDVRSHYRQIIPMQPI